MDVNYFLIYLLGALTIIEGSKSSDCYVCMNEMCPCHPYI